MRINNIQSSYYYNFTTKELSSVFGNMEEPFVRYFNGLVENNTPGLLYNLDYLKKEDLKEFVVYLEELPEELKPELARVKRTNEKGEEIVELHFIHKDVVTTMCYAGDGILKLSKDRMPPLFKEDYNRMYNLSDDYAKWDKNGLNKETNWLGLGEGMVLSRNEKETYIIGKNKVEYQAEGELSREEKEAGKELADMLNAFIRVADGLVSDFYFEIHKKRYPDFISLLEGTGLDTTKPFHVNRIGFYVEEGIIKKLPEDIVPFDLPKVSYEIARDRWEQRVVEKNWGIIE